LADAEVERRLAVILCADVVGYSRLMGADEEGTHQALKAYRREVVDPRLAEHRDRPELASAMVERILLCGHGSRPQIAKKARRVVQPRVMSSGFTPVVAYAGSPVSGTRPALVMPCTAQVSSFSEVSPLMPTAPTIAPAASRMRTPPGTGTMRPPDAS
jgi:class 3 adenylate cyclase